MQQKKFIDCFLSELKYEYIHTSFVTMRNFKQVVQNVEKTYTILLNDYFLAIVEKIKKMNIGFLFKKY